MIRIHRCWKESQECPETEIVLRNSVSIILPKYVEFRPGSTVVVGGEHHWRSRQRQLEEDYNHQSWENEVGDELGDANEVELKAQNDWGETAGVTFVQFPM